MVTFNEMSNEALANASVLTDQQKRLVLGGRKRYCYLRCDQSQAGDGSGYEVPDCSRETAEEYCKEGLSKAVCNCTGE